MSSLKIVRGWQRYHATFVCVQLLSLASNTSFQWWLICRLSRYFLVGHGIFYSLSFLLVVVVVIRSAFPCKSRQLEEAITHRSTFRGLRGGFEQSLRFRSTQSRWTQKLSVFTSTLPVTGRRSRTCATRVSDVISERKTQTHTCRLYIAA